MVVMIGLWIFLWAAWGGSIDTFTASPGIEAGLGLNPPKI